MAETSAPAERQEAMVHLSPSWLLNSQFRTSVTVVGCGGTGTHVMYCLAEMHKALIALGHMGLLVRVYDQDTVEHHNVGRQRFGLGDIEENKAMATIARINRMYGTDWMATPERFKPTKENGHKMGNIVITAVDEGKVRNQVHECFKRAIGINRMNAVMNYQEHGLSLDTRYWLDLGNDKDYGQAVLAAEDLPTRIDLFGPAPEVKQKGSCSTEESLRSQDLFINQTIAVTGVNLLWQLFRKGGLRFNIVYVNIGTGTTRCDRKKLINTKPVKHADQDKSDRAE